MSGGMEMLVLCVAAFSAGFVDAIVGGGGLIQTPAVLITLPQHPVATLLGTTKIPSFTGTAMAAAQYAGKIALHKRLLLVMCLFALPAAFSGSYLVSLFSSHFVKPLIFIVLAVVAVYTFVKKDFGVHRQSTALGSRQLLRCALFAAVVGFYDGFVGPGVGSFLLLFFIRFLGFDFLEAGAHAKFVNLSTNAGSIIFFGMSGHILFAFAIPMAFCNLTGAVLGSRLALLKGSRFVRIFFLLVVAATLVRLGYDIFNGR